MTTLGRALGSGTLRKVDRGSGAYWVLDWRDGSGIRRRTALGSDRRVAERRRAELVSSRDLQLSGLGAIEGMSLALTELRDVYLADLVTRVGAKQRRSITDALARVLGRVSAQRVRDLRALDLMRYRSARLAEGVSNRTVNVDCGAVRSMCRWAVLAGIIAENPVANLKPLPTGERHRRRVRRALSEQEVERLLVAAAKDDAACTARMAAERTIHFHGRGQQYAARKRPKRVPQAPLWRALLESAARWGELTSVTWADLDAERRALTLRAATTKAGRTRVIPLREGLVAELLALRAVHRRVRMRLVQPGDRIFLSPDGSNWAAYTNNARRLLRRLLDDAGIARVDAAGQVVDVHSLRHSALTRMARRGVPLIVAQRIAGHADPRITAAVYMHLDLEDLRVAVDAAPTTTRLVRGAQEATA